MLEKLKAAMNVGWWVCGPGVTALVFLGCWALTKDLGTAMWVLPAGGGVSIAMAFRLQ